MTQTKSLKTSTILLQFFLGAGFVLALNLAGAAGSSLQGLDTPGTWFLLIGACLLGGAGGLFIGRQLEGKASHPPLAREEEVRSNVCFWFTLASASIGAVLMGSVWIGGLYGNDNKLDSCCSENAALKALR